MIIFYFISIPLYGFDHEIWGIGNNREAKMTASLYFYFELNLYNQVIVILFLQFPLSPRNYLIYFQDLDSDSTQKCVSYLKLVICRIYNDNSESSLVQLK